MSRKLTVGSLFAGIGGFDLGFERAGFEIKFQVEIDPFCRRVLEKHWPTVKRYEDVRTIGAELERVDCIVGGFPCQPVSSAGQRTDHAADERWLWPEYARLVRELRPRYVVVENVAGLLQRGMGDVLGDLAACGYDADWTSVSAKQMGAPHERERVFIVAYPNAQHGQARMGNGHEETRPVLCGSYPQRADFWVAAACKAVGVDDGLCPELYRVRVESVGNAIVPQIAEWIARRIQDAEAGLR